MEPTKQKKMAVPKPSGTAAGEIPRGIKLGGRAQAARREPSNRRKEGAKGGAKGR